MRTIAQRHPNTLLLTLLLASAAAAQAPMSSDYSRSTTHRLLAKPVLATRLLDNCESIDTWTAVKQDQGDPKISITHERSKDGQGSLRLRSKTTGPTPIPRGRYYGTSSAVRVVKGEDWSGWNRLSFWVYPDLKGFRNVSLIVIFHNDGKVKLPEPYGKMGKNYVLLNNQAWNHVVWEIGNLPRDRVSGGRTTDRERLHALRPQHACPAGRTRRQFFARQHHRLLYRLDGRRRSTRSRRRYRAFTPRWPRCAG